MLHKIQKVTEFLQDLTLSRALFSADLHKRFTFKETRDAMMNGEIKQTSNISSFKKKKSLDGTPITGLWLITTIAFSFFPVRQIYIHLLLASRIPAAEFPKLRSRLSSETNEIIQMTRHNHRPAIYHSRERGTRLYNQARYSRDSLLTYNMIWQELTELSTIIVFESIAIKIKFLHFLQFINSEKEKIDSCLVNFSQIQHVQRIPASITRHKKRGKHWRFDSVYRGPGVNCNST